MSNSAIGIFDSGLGGITAVKQLKKVMPKENIVYFGDTGRVPYGNRSRDTIIKYARQDASFLLTHNVKIVIAACGTVSSVAECLKEELPVLYTGVVRPTAFAAVAATKCKKIGVIGTTATIGSHSYKKEIMRFNPDIEVVEQDCPLFVSLVESGFISKDDPIVSLTVERYLKPVKEAGVDTLILGCTHYPILSEAISEYMGDHVALIDSGKETAIYAAKILKEHSLLNAEDDGHTCEFYVSDTPDGFAKVAGLFLGEDVGDCVKQIDIGCY